MKSFLKRILPASVVRFLLRTKVNLDSRFISWAQRSRFYSDLYYFVNNGFSIEHQSVLKGRKAYYDSLKDIGETCALLRRNTHRLEKGLIMRPRRTVFAEGFIRETVDCYANAVVSTKLAEAEKKWATDVLDEYFNVVESTPIIEEAANTFEKSRRGVRERLDLTAEFPSRHAAFKPYFYEDLKSSNISFGELKKLFIRRRSVRWYQDKQVPIKQVQKAANIASFAPSACNRQPYRFLFCNKKEKAVSIAKCAGGTKGFAENLPAMIVVVGDLSAYPYERDRHLIYIDGSLAAMQLMLALETLGLSTCSINWPEVDSSEQKIRKIIKLKDYERIVMLLAVGYADAYGGIPYSQKKESQLILEDISR
ncbi:nitroreductase family protein [Natronospirillum operosum]|uniref:Nitroreductase family protein n=1 Tax=Natronospirillum operosum TaxID=2759953 RepID=A0A4Z0WAS7_9GAMM|nr:nitroreductase family protein [Natronospirillum operosum]TGG95252.1 nitroreductase family protein [Natronospirillum operosum]